MYLTGTRTSLVTELATTGVPATLRLRFAVLAAALAGAGLSAVLLAWGPHRRTGRTSPSAWSSSWPGFAGPRTSERAVTPCQGDGPFLRGSGLGAIEVLREAFEQGPQVVSVTGEAS